jgi:hypothetical protein
LANNASVLDNQNGGFVVFGRVVSGMNILKRFNTTFNDANTAVDAVVDLSSIGFPTFPATTSSGGTVQIDDMLFTVISVLQAPAVSIHSGKSVKTAKASVSISGAISDSVTRIEWRVGKAGKFHHKPASGFWKIAAAGMKKGRNFVYVRGVSASGEKSALQKVKIIRK